MFKVVKLESGDQIIASWDIVGHLAGWIDTLFQESEKLKNCGILSALILNHENKIYRHGGFIAPNLIVSVSYALNEEYYGQYCDCKIKWQVSSPKKVAFCFALTISRDS
jgi:hypothetical protein